jgi:hypothetical protein
MDFNIDNYLANVEKQLKHDSFIGKMERSVSQHICKQTNVGISQRGQMFNDMLANVERVMTGQKKHGFQQNKKTDLEKLIEKGVKNGTGN